jgi:L-ascorbate metabolism protein UlaG (beta-lactamase superfamily)
MNQSFTNNIETDSFQTKEGKTITVHFIQHASFFFTFSGVTIYADPVSFEGVDYKKLPKADIIFITHDHYDHFDKNVITDISTPTTKIFCNATVQSALGTGIGLDNDDEIPFRLSMFGDIAFDFYIQAVPAYNTTPERTMFHPRGSDNGYIITLSGTRIYIPGDCENMPEMSEFNDIDVAFLPINQPYTMTVEQAINAANTIKPKILYPIHYNETDLEGLSVLKKEGIDVRIFKM